MPRRYSLSRVEVPKECGIPSTVRGTGALSRADAFPRTWRPSWAGCDRAISIRRSSKASRRREETKSQTSHRRHLGDPRSLPPRCHRFCRTELRPRTRCERIRGKGIVPVGGASSGSEGWGGGPPGSARQLNVRAAGCAPLPDSLPRSRAADGGHAARCQLKDLHHVAA